MVRSYLTKESDSQRVSYSNESNSLRPHAEMLWQGIRLTSWQKYKWLAITLRAILAFKLKMVVITAAVLSSGLYLFSASRKMTASAASLSTGMRAGQTDSRVTSPWTAVPGLAAWEHLRIQEEWRDPALPSQLSRKLVPGRTALIVQWVGLGFFLPLVYSFTL